MLEYYRRQLPSYGWEIPWITPNDHGGYIIYRDGVLDFIYIFEQDDLTFVLIWIAASSPSMNP